MIPNDWTFQGPKDFEEQKKYYETMLEACDRHSWIGGFSWWAWESNCTDEGYPADQSDLNRCFRYSCAEIPLYFLKILLR